MDLSRICVFKEEGISGEGGAPHIRLTKKHKGGQMRKPASRDNPAARELKITRALNLDRVKTVRV